MFVTSAAPASKDELQEQLSAIGKIIEALAPLSAESRDQVMEFVHKKLGMAANANAANPSNKSSPTLQSQSNSSSWPTTTVRDIQTLKEEKHPTSANQMAALVAYYLSEVAPPAERKDEISKEDVLRFFKQASFALPRRPDVTLQNAQNAGYFDSGSDRGKFKLNPVGYNLVAHGLPKGSSKQRKAARKAPKKFR